MLRIMSTVYVLLGTRFFVSHLDTYPDSTNDASCSKKLQLNRLNRYTMPLYLSVFVCFFLIIIIISSTSKVWTPRGMSPLCKPFAMHAKQPYRFLLNISLFWSLWRFGTRPLTLVRTVYGLLSLVLSLSLLFVWANAPRLSPLFLSS